MACLVPATESQCFVCPKLWLVSSICSWKNVRGEFPLRGCSGSRPNLASPKRKDAASGNTTAPSPMLGMPLSCHYIRPQLPAVRREHLRTEREAVAARSQCLIVGRVCPCVEARCAEGRRVQQSEWEGKGFQSRLDQLQPQRQLYRQPLHEVLMWLGKNVQREFHGDCECDTESQIYQGASLATTEFHRPEPDTFKPPFDSPYRGCLRSSESACLEVSHFFARGLASVLLFSALMSPVQGIPSALAGPLHPTPVHLRPLQEDNAIGHLPSSNLSFVSGKSSPGVVLSTSAGTSREGDGTPSLGLLPLALEETQTEEEKEGKVVPEELVLEAWSVVHDTFLDARGGGWTQEKWDAARAAALRRAVRSLPEARSIISTMITTLKDPYSRYLSPEQFARLAKYDITGVGLNIGDVPGPDARRRPVVVGIVLGSPAYKAGIRQGDRLVSVDGVDVSGMSSFDVASLIQGTKGTPVSITISRNNSLNGIAMTGSDSSSSSSIISTKNSSSCALELCTFTILRAAEAPATPVSYRLERRWSAQRWGSQGEQEEAVLTGYIRVKEFNAVAKRDLAEAITRLQAMGVQSLVLDLQDNPGGLVQAGVESAKLFLNEGATVVFTRARGGAASERGVVASLPPLTDIPLTVLVNGRTASASEIVAAALHDNCRAVLVGTTTFGKGLIQSVYELQDGSGLILTVGKYVTPAHQDIDGNGIQPDFRRTPGLDIAQHRLQSCRTSAQLK